MTFSLIDFLIGIFLMNAMPHMLFGLIRLRFLSLFGFSAWGNLLYSLVNIFAAGALYHHQYGINALKLDGISLGALAMLAIYLVTGRFFVVLFQEKTKPPFHEPFSIE